MTYTREKGLCKPGGRKYYIRQTDTTIFPLYYLIVLYTVASGVSLLAGKSRRVWHRAGQGLLVVVAPAPHQAEGPTLPGPAGPRHAPMLQARRRDRAAYPGYH